MGRKRIVLLFGILVLCCGVCCVTAAAAFCGLRVNVYDRGTPVAGMTVELCQVAARQKEDFVLTEDFSQLPTSAQKLAEEMTAGQAEQVYNYIRENGLQGMLSHTDAYGNADFRGLEEGLYLVSEPGGQAVTFRPYLICLISEHADVLYTTPKVIPGQTRSIRVCKQWEDDHDRAGMRPEVLQVTLLWEEEPIRTVTLSEACDWEHTFTHLPTEGTYTVTEQDVEGYRGSCYEEEGGFVLVNTYKEKPLPPGHDPVPPKPQDPVQPPEPSQPPAEPTLPQTGFQMWPVYLLMGVGTLLVICGLTDLCLSREETWKEEKERSC